MPSYTAPLSVLCLHTVILCALLISLLFVDADALLTFNPEDGCVAVEDANSCLQTMCEVDSGCVPKGCSVDQNSRIGCGYFRLNIFQFRQCYQPGKKEDEEEEIAWIHCAEDYDCSAQCIRTLGSRFRVKCYGKSDCEALARIHNGGANGCRDRNTAFYWRNVRERCGERCNKPIWRRH